MLKPLCTHMTADYRPLNNANVQLAICYSVQILLTVIDINSELLQTFVLDVAACVHCDASYLSQKLKVTPRFPR